MKFSGIVKRHTGRGKRLGFPTANLDCPDEIEEGIYVGYATVENKMPSLIFIGAAKTFGETERRCEVYILDFDQDLYEQELEVELLKKIRGNIKFRLESKLVAQMRMDEQYGREYFASHRPPSPREGRD